MATDHEIESAVRKFITENFLFRNGAEALSETASFIETGLIDSTGILELVFFIEKTFGIKVADEDMVPENLDSVRQVAAYVRRKVAQRSAA